MRNSIGIISCERFFSRITIKGSFISQMKRNIYKTAVTFFQIEQPLNPLPQGQIYAPSPAPAICGLLKA